MARKKVRTSSVSTERKNAQAKSPFMQNTYEVLPTGGHNSVVDFWSTLFAWDDASFEDDQEPITFLAQKILRHLKNLGFEIEGDSTETVTSFSGGFLGVGREMLVLSNARAKAMIYFKQIGDLGYVSLRVVYTQPFSALKIGRFFLVSLLTGMLALNYGSYRLPNEVFTMCNLLPVVLFVVWGFISLHTTGQFLGFLREDLQEVYRDDLASIGAVAYGVILMSADELSLKVMQPDDSQPPTFGAVADNPRTQRPSRI